MITQEKQNIIVNYLKPYDPEMIGVFGSYSRGENKDGSDLDLLVNLRVQSGLLTLVKIESELSEKVGIKIDLVTKGALKNKTLIEYIQKDLKVIF